MPSDETVLDTGGVHLPPSLYDYIQGGPTYQVPDSALAAAGGGGDEDDGKQAGGARRKGGSAAEKAAAAALSEDRSARAASAAAGAKPAAGGGGTGSLWLRFSDTSTYEDPQRPSHAGSFYQASAGSVRV